ncbi:MAG: sigma-70 family RNA polymerase sigma factor [Defluviitaleaceae bacterium]|nr:sigma-70 family RNA polymerase sigma factor [Defluviitaleaceae bacterium]
MEDGQIVALYLRRDAAAISESDAKYGRLLKTISYNILSSREDSEECVSDAYVKAWNSIPPQQPSSLFAYLGRIARNLSLNRWHENRAQKRGGAALILTELTDCVPSAASVEASVEAAELSAAVTRWLNALPQDDRVLFLRRYWYGERLDSLAKACGVAQNRLAGRMFRLRGKLKSALEKEGITL